MTAQELVARSSAQRAAIIASAQPLLQAVEAPDRLIGFVRSHPVPIALGALAFALLGGRKALSLATRAATLYMLLRG